MINLNDTIPAAPNGGVNIHFQEDASGNVSAYTGLSPNSPSLISPVAGVVTANMASTNVVYVNVNAAVTSFVATNPTDGQVSTVLWIQDGTGHAVAYSANFLGATAPSTGANTQSIQQVRDHAVDTNWYGVATGQTGL